MNDLTELALSALEREEANDNAGDEQDTSNGSEDENDSSNTDENGGDGAEDKGEDEKDNTDNKDGENSDDNSEDDKKGEEDPEDKGESDDTEEEKEDKKKSDEMTDEEFEELAKKRGYSKKNEEEEEKKKAEEEEKKRAEAINSIPKPKELDADTWAAMPPMNKFVYSQLPLLVAHGKDGDVKVKVAEQLPDDFEFASDKARSEFANAIQSQESLAQSIVANIQNRAKEQQYVSAQTARARAIISEVTALQDSGELPKPKAQPNTPEFDNDPAVKAINKVLNYQVERAKKGVNLSVRDALVLYRAEHPEEFKQEQKKAENKEEAKGDNERKNVAKKIAGNNKSTDKVAADETDGSKRKYYKPGMSTQDVLDRVLQDLD